MQNWSCWGVRNDFRGWDDGGRKSRKGRDIDGGGEPVGNSNGDGGWGASGELGDGKSVMAIATVVVWVGGGGFEGEGMRRSRGKLWEVFIILKFFVEWKKLNILMGKEMFNPALWEHKWVTGVISAKI